jgi:hypothetical protein
MSRALVVLWVLAVTGGCGRIGFDSIAGEGGPQIASVTPIWTMPDGGPIEVVFVAPAADAMVTLGGAVCTGATFVDAVTLQCTAPPHAPASVDVVATDAGGATAVFDRRFTYLTPGGYQHGGPLLDRTSGVAVDGDGNVYVSGATTGDLDQPNAGGDDAIVVKYDVSGALAWVRQLGTPAFDYARDVAVDPSGDVTIVGYSAGDLDANGVPPGGNDIFVARFAPDGTRRWLVQTGTPGDDQAWDLGVDDDGGVVVAARTTGALGSIANAGGFDYGIIRYTPAGAVEWTHQGGTVVDDIGHSITATPDGVAYLVGYTDAVVEPGGASAGGRDLFVARYERDGTQAWIRQRGSAGTDLAHDATVDDAGEVWIAGHTDGQLDGNPNAGGVDVFVMSMSAAGAWRWTRVRGSPAGETTFGVAVAPTGQVYLSCTAGAAFDGQISAGGADVCVIAFDRDGNHTWTRLHGSPLDEATSSCAVDRDYTGLLYVSLITDGSLDGRPNRGTEDIAVLKIDASGVAL